MALSAIESPAKSKLPTTNYLWIKLKEQHLIDSSLLNPNPTLIKTNAVPFFWLDPYHSTWKLHLYYKIGGHCSGISRTSMSKHGPGTLLASSPGLFFLLNDNERNGQTDERVRKIGLVSIAGVVVRMRQPLPRFWVIVYICKLLGFFSIFLYSHSC